MAVDSDCVLTAYVRIHHPERQQLEAQRLEALLNIVSLPLFDVSNVQCR